VSQGFAVLKRHLAPGVVPQLTVAATLAFASMIPLEAALSYLGLGIARPPFLGGTSSPGAESSAAGWWMILFPALAIVAP